MKDELERIGKETIVAKTSYYSDICIDEELHSGHTMSESRFEPSTSRT
jgi:hypothetical protein